MEDIISINTKVSEIEQILTEHNIAMPPYWMIVLNGVLNGFPNKKAKVVGYGDNARFEEVED